MREIDRAKKRIEELEIKLSSARDILTRVHEFLRFKSTPITRAEATIIERLGYAITESKPKPYSSSGYSSFPNSNPDEYQGCAVCDKSTYFEHIWESDKGFVCKDCYDEQQPDKESEE